MKVLLAAFALVLMLIALGLLFSTRGDAQIPGTYQGKSAQWWSQKTTHWKKAALKRGQILEVHKQVNRERVHIGSNGVARGLICIHGFEGSWQDPHAPFWGGLQMDMNFQRSYGREFLNALGTADNWPPFVQMAVAMRAYYSGRGFTPWPSTRRSCGI